METHSVAQLSRTFQQQQTTRPLTFLQNRPQQNHRASLLGVAPLPPADNCMSRVRFPFRPSQRGKPDSHQKVPDRKRAGSGAGSGDGKRCCSTTEEERAVSQNQQEKAALDEEQDGAELKRQRRTGLEETGPLTDEEWLLLSPDQPGSDSCSCGDSAVHPTGQQGGAESYEESRAAEVQSVGSLTVTIQRSNESREFRQTDRQTDRSAVRQTDRQTERSADQQTDRFYCHVCNISCPNQQLFQEHMTGEEHQDRLKSCLITLLSSATHTPELDRGRQPNVQRWCATCQSHFSGDLILHRRTNQHKLCKQSSRPFCPVCKRHFRTPRKFVEHMKSPEHKQQVRLEEALEEELITVDAVGCFEGEEERKVEEGKEEEKEREEEEGKGAGKEEEEESRKFQEDMEQPADKEEESGRQGYDPKTTYGSRFVVPVCGFLCQLCHKFFHCEDTARHAHCRTHTHYLNLQKYTAKTKHRRSSMDNKQTHTDTHRHRHRQTHTDTVTDKRAQTQ